MLTNQALSRHTGWAKRALIVIITLGIGLFGYGCTSQWIQKRIQKPCTLPIVYAQDINPAAFWPDERLKHAFCTYWTYRYTDLFEKAYNMEAPQFRDAFHLGQYTNYVKKTSSNKLKRLTLKKWGSETENLIFIECRFELIKASGVVQSVSQLDWWEQKNGRWFHALRDQLFFRDVQYK